MRSSLAENSFCWSARSWVTAGSSGAAGGLALGSGGAPSWSRRALSAVSLGWTSATTLWIWVEIGSSAARSLTSSESLIVSPDASLASIWSRPCLAASSRAAGSAPAGVSAEAAAAGAADGACALLSAPIAGAAAQISSSARSFARETRGIRRAKAVSESFAASGSGKIGPKEGILPLPGPLTRQRSRRPAASAAAAPVGAVRPEVVFPSSSSNIHFAAPRASSSSASVAGGSA